MVLVRGLQEHELAGCFFSRGLRLFQILIRDSVFYFFMYVSFFLQDEYDP